ncbi:hypothetical protein BKA66DRAFT_462689 [Pyrenochaeta sp. MPI-SDFR-AT-0127]|nr:hypothetical protein BKA66DRAFT_462689 [Pyrenochaeta sp. MPI-SDFR-AT-0127]
MAAYHDSDWAECYDLWVRRLFGEGPAEDIPIFEKILHDIVASKPSDLEISIIDVGTGSGRVLIDLRNVMHEMHGRKYQVWGTEPSAPMLDRAKRFWGEAVEKRKTLKEEHDNKQEDQIKARWSQHGATDFAQETWEHLGRGADLVIFAAGGISHVIDDKDIKLFLEEASEVIAPDGKVVISILRDYMPEPLDQDAKNTSLKDQDAAMLEFLSKPQRIESKDHIGRVYVKYPAVETQNGDIKTETFLLNVYDADGETLLRSSELSWDTKMFNAVKMQDMIRSSELKVAEVIEGKIQVWWVLQKSR